ncbi:hypothetical protein JCM3766R1_000076 [Sporobolomyces carnicolor]
MSDLDAREAPRYPSTLAPKVYYQGLAERITENLLPVFSRLFDLTTTVTVLELASGNGLHSLVYSNAFPNVTFQPTECDSLNVRAIDDTCRGVRANETGGVRRALELDVMRDDDWTKLERGGAGFETSSPAHATTYDLVIGHNFLHMIPFPEGPQTIFRNLANPNLVSAAHGLVAFYGPFKHDDGFFSEGDSKFNAEISSRPSSYPLGLRSIDALARIAQTEGWDFVDRIPMPKGNWVLLFKVKGAETPRIERSHPS